MAPDVRHVLYLGSQDAEMVLGSRRTFCMVAWIHAPRTRNGPFQSYNSRQGT